MVNNLYNFKEKMEEIRKRNISDKIPKMHNLYSQRELIATRNRKRNSLSELNKDNFTHNRSGEVSHLKKSLI